jgi:hypothetical protein
MPDAVIENAIKALKKRRDEIDGIIQSLERVTGGAPHAAQSAPASKKVSSKKRTPMSAAAKARLRATYAKNHPGWKPKKK